MKIWTCYRGCPHEGGDVEALKSSFDGAMDWLRAERDRALTGAIRMNEANRKWWEEHLADLRAEHPELDYPDESPDEAWTVSEIQTDGERASFEDPITLFAVRPMVVDP